MANRGHSFFPSLFSYPFSMSLLAESLFSFASSLPRPLLSGLSIVVFCVALCVCMFALLSVPPYLFVFFTFCLFCCGPPPTHGASKTVFSFLSCFFFFSSRSLTLNDVYMVDEASNTRPSVKKYVTVVKMHV